jgi:hypothetical protein
VIIIYIAIIEPQRRQVKSIAIVDSKFQGANTLIPFLDQVHDFLLVAKSLEGFENR